MKKNKITRRFKKQVQSFFFILMIIQLFDISLGYGLSKIRQGIEAVNRQKELTTSFSLNQGSKEVEEDIFFFTKEIFIEEMRYLLKTIEEVTMKEIRIEIKQEEEIEKVLIIFSENAREIAEEIFLKGREGKMKSGIELEDLFYDLLRDEIKYGETNLFFRELRNIWKKAKEKIDRLEVVIREEEDHPLVIELSYYSPLVEGATYQFELYDKQDPSLFDISPWEYREILEEITWDKLQFLEGSGKLFHTGKIKIQLEYPEGVDRREIGSRDRDKNK